MDTNTPPWIPCGSPGTAGILQDLSQVATGEQVISFRDGPCPQGLDFPSSVICRPCLAPPGQVGKSLSIQEMLMAKVYSVLIFRAVSYLMTLTNLPVRTFSTPHFRDRSTESHGVKDLSRITWLICNKAGI